jgi:hypothetical protein
MYDLLTTNELNILRSMLYRAAEEAYWVAGSRLDDPYWTGQYRPVHKDIALLFLDAGGELVRRLDDQFTAA